MAPNEIGLGETTFAAERRHVVPCELFFSRIRPSDHGGVIEIYLDYVVRRLPTTFASGDGPSRRFTSASQTVPVRKPAM